VNGWLLAQLASFHGVIGLVNSEEADNAESEANRK
jgi:hypothetical protein